MKIFKEIADRLLYIVVIALVAVPLAYAANNYAATEGAGKTFGCVDVAGVCYPLFIPADGGGVKMTDDTNHRLNTNGNIADGADVALGATADPAWSGSGAGSLIAIQKAAYAALLTGAATNGTTYPTSSIGIGGKDGSGNIQPPIMSNWGTAPLASPAFGVNAYQFTGGNPVLDNPCKTVAQTYTPITITTNTTTRIIAPTSAKKTIICAFSIQVALADNVGIVEGTGGTCGAGTAGVYGGTTAASGLNLVANQGIAWGNGDSPVMQTAGTNVDFCLITSAATNLAGGVFWVQK